MQALWMSCKFDTHGRQERYTWDTKIRYVACIDMIRMLHIVSIYDLRPKSYRALQNRLDLCTLSKIQLSQ